ncbi:hypothetical protein AO385_1268 [Moraxella catarrhalis]|uniref:Uncharacterized protein n=1 Tax=Moraxella catarrhalis TaxID=480 RepID=A0A198UPK8_MORCA|nr:hypothetical protein AO383_1195 [Moraxella catarrhalis]OAU98453.1 hypothetical protein AO384_0037 [Moraxella catarrhalis]OAV00199.1 hypothetical protein AO385_1268 [Moraxella catarrhalis]
MGKLQAVFGGILAILNKNSWSNTPLIPPLNDKKNRRLL